MPPAPVASQATSGIGRIASGLLLIVLIGGLAIGGYVLAQRGTFSGVAIAVPPTETIVALPTETALPVTLAPSIPANIASSGSWQQALQQALAQTIEPGTLPPIAVTSAPIAAGSTSGDGGQAFAVPVAAATVNRPDQLTVAAPTAAPSPLPLNVVSGGAVNPRLNQWSLPPQPVPLSRDPRDHFYFRRPVDANANSTSLFSYPYGSMGPGNAWRVHHGVDLPNPDGRPVRAAADGVVVWAADHYRWVENEAVVDEAESYGNVVIIAHNFGYKGQQLYTLYAHLSHILVTQNQTVKAGDVVGLSGHSGQVSGPHVHFEVRQGDNLYFDTRNPLLWMAPLTGRGVIAGRLLYQNGHAVENAAVTLIANGKEIDHTSTYVYPKMPGVAAHQVDGDDQWHETFAFGDVPTGTYEVRITIDSLNLTLTHYISVQEGTTALVDFGYIPAP